MWYHAHPEYEALWTTLEQIDMEELQRQLDAAHRQIEEQQRIIDDLRQQLQHQHNTTGMFDEPGR